MKRASFPAALFLLLCVAAAASSIPRRAVITGAGGAGKCTVEVSVDGSAEVEVSGDAGVLRTLSGEPAVWRRFQCNQPMPRNPDEFRFVGVDGRGRVVLTRDPRGNRGAAVVHISDPKHGREGYTFDLQWRGESRPVDLPHGGSPVNRAIHACQDSVTGRLNRDGYRSVSFERIAPGDQPGRRDWITGSVTARRGYDSSRFRFSCSVDFSSGRVRTVDVRPR